jgi:hypothetical protein
MQVLREAEELLEKVVDYNMVMALPTDIPTLEAMATKNWTQPENIFCSENTEEMVTICNTDPRLRGSGTDHMPILTTLELPASKKKISPACNWRLG